MTFFANIPDEEEEIEEEEASLDDELLAELDPLDDAVVEEEPLTEGFGEVPEEEEKAIEKAIDKAEDEDEDGDEALEEDAEDVDFDTFDDIDDM